MLVVRIALGIIIGEERGLGKIPNLGFCGIRFDHSACGDGPVPLRSLRRQFLQLLFRIREDVEPHGEAVGKIVGDSIAEGLIRALQYQT
jgi:hypothetical protein